MSRAQHILAVIVGLITGVLLMECYGAMVTAARAGRHPRQRSPGSAMATADHGRSP